MEESQSAWSIANSVEIFALMSAPALIGGCVLSGIYLWLRHSGVGLQKKILLMISQIILFYLCSFGILILDRGTVLNGAVRPILEVVGLDGFSPFFFAGQLFALLISVLLLEVFRNKND